MGSLSAWTARAPGGTTSSSSGCGVASSTRRCISELTTPRPRRAHRSGVTSTSTIADDRIRVLTAPPPITPTSPRCPSAWQPNPGGRSTYRRGNSVQTTGATSVDDEDLRYEIDGHIEDWFKGGQFKEAALKFLDKYGIEERHITARAMELRVPQLVGIE